MTRSKIAENTLFLTASGAASVVFTLAQLAVLSRFMDADGFGLFVALRGFSLLLATVILVGLPQVLVRFLPTFEARGAANRSIAVFFAASALVAALGAALLWTSGLWQRAIPSGVRSLAGSPALMLWMILSSITLALKMLLYGGFNGLREMRMQMLLELAYLFLLTAYVVHERERLDAAFIFAAMFFLNAAVFAAGVPLFVRLARDCAAAAAPPESVVVPNLLSYWAGSICLGIVALAFTDVDRFVMSSVLPMAAISLFHVASRVDALLKRFLALPVLAAQPEITRVYEEGRWTDIAGRMGLFTKGMVAAALVCTALFAVIGRDIIVLLSGGGYAGAYRVFLVLLPTVPVAAVTAPLLATMRSLHFMRWAVFCDFLWMAVYFGTFFSLASAFGPEGMAAAQVAASVAQMAAAVILARREGFYGGVGARLGRLFLALAPATAAGMLLTASVPLYASIAAAACFPFLARELLWRLRVFDRDETGRILALVTVPAGRRFAAWMLSAERRPRPGVCS